MTKRVWRGQEFDRRQPAGRVMAWELRLDDLRPAERPDDSDLGEKAFTVDEAA